MVEVQAAVKEFEGVNPEMILLQCTSAYPMDEAFSNLNVIRTYQEKFKVITGYSDHSQGMRLAPLSVALGACVIEKHFTLDKTMRGPDHDTSLDPEELARFILEIRETEKILGSTEKKVTEIEKNTRISLQKSLVAKKDIAVGEEFSRENIIAKRAGGQGVSPVKVYEVYGKKSFRAFKKDEVISF